MQETNQESMTLPEWLGAAGLSDKHYFSMWHEICVTNAARQAWMQGEDPTEYRNDHSSLEAYYLKSLEPHRITGIDEREHGKGQNP